MKFSNRMLFGVTTVSLVFVVIAFGYFFGQIRSFDSLGVVERVAFICGVFGFFGLWFGALAHFFMNKSIKNKIAWGFALILLSWLGALAYYFAYIVRETRCHDESTDCS